MAAVACPRQCDERAGDPQWKDGEQHTDRNGPQQLLGLQSGSIPRDEEAEGVITLPEAVVGYYRCWDRGQRSCPDSGQDIKHACSTGETSIM